MARVAQDVTETELALLQVLWDRGRCSIRQLTDTLYPEGAAAQYATVQKLLERLEAKGFVERDRTLFVHVFSPAIGKEDLIGRRLRAVADKLCGGSLVPLLSHLVRTAPLTPRERRSLRELIGQPGRAQGAGMSGAALADGDTAGRGAETSEASAAAIDESEDDRSDNGGGHDALRGRGGRRR